MAAHQLCPRPLPTACSYIWLSFSNLLSPTMYILLKSLFAVSILHVFIPKPSPFPFLCESAIASISTHLSPTYKELTYTPLPFTPDSALVSFLSPSFTFVPSCSEERSTFTYSQQKNIALLRHLSHSSILLCLEPTKCTAHCRWVTSPACCDLYF